MKSFPETIHRDKKSDFKKINYERLIQLFRQLVYEHIIISDEENYVELDKFASTHKVSDEDFGKIVETIRDELHELKWKTEVTFGDTALFIYSDKKPKTCWFEEF
jgi:hypothetical protein